MAKPDSITSSISEPHPPVNLPSPEVDEFRESMRQLLQMILDFFEEEYTKVEEGILNEEETLLQHDVQENDPDTQFNTRSVPENFKRLRA